MFDSIYIISLLPLCIPHLIKGEDFISPFGRGEGEFPDTPVIVLNIISVCLLPVLTCSTHNPVNKMASAVGRKRAINEENRKFNEAWTQEFLMIALPHNAGMSCLECADVIKTMKRNNAKLHFNAKHAATYAQLNAEAKQDRITALLNNRRSQQRMFTAPVDANNKVALAGLKIVHAINKRGRLELLAASLHSFM